MTISIFLLYSETRRAGIELLMQNTDKVRTRAGGKSEL